VEVDDKIKTLSPQAEQELKLLPEGPGRSDLSDPPPVQDEDLVHIRVSQEDPFRGPPDQDREMGLREGLFDRPGTGCHDDHIPDIPQPDQQDLPDPFKLHLFFPIR